MTSVEIVDPGSRSNLGPPAFEVEGQSTDPAFWFKGLPSLGNDVTFIYWARNVINSGLFLR